ncbi:hypothetical protein [Streptomyces cinereoruber]|uniref:hypothetical protein n=1 Tax=Streptomyces cinereoruber TaxID=67260 RepID=UPI003395D155
MSARRAARAAAARAAVEAPPVSFDWRHPLYGIAEWPPSEANPVPMTVVSLARRQARAARQEWEAEQAG